MVKARSDLYEFELNKKRNPRGRRKSDRIPAWGVLRRDGAARLHEDQRPAVGADGACKVGSQVSACARGPGHGCACRPLPNACCEPPRRKH